MEKMTVNQIGVLHVNGERFAVIEPPKTNAPAKPVDASILYGQVKAVNYLVARTFFVEKNVEGIMTGETVFVSPRWMSIVGSFIVEWFPFPNPIEVLMPKTGEVINE